jgi:hypothetical protein
LSPQSVTALLEREVAGEYNTFRVYIVMLRVNEASARDVAQLAGFSSSALAVHHLEKLKSLNLVNKDPDGTYHVVRCRFGILKFFFLVKKIIVPRSLFYAVLYGVLIVFSLWQLSGTARVLAVLFSLLGFGIQLVETVQFYKILPQMHVQEVEQTVRENSLK